MILNASYDNKKSFVKKKINVISVLLGDCFTDNNIMRKFKIKGYLNTC